MPRSLIRADCRNGCVDRNGRPKKAHAKGLCNACYRREDWIPAGGPGVEAQQERERVYQRKRQRQIREYTGQAGRPRVAAKCQVCGVMKQRPSSICQKCGDDPVTYNGDRYEYDRAHGWDSL